MSKDIMRICSNISSSLIIRDEARKVSLRKSVEKARKLEEEENYRIYGYRWPNAYMKSHKADYLAGRMHGYEYDKSKYCSVSSYYNDSDYCTIYFYEWSSLEGNQHRFYSFNNFYSYCVENGIIVSEDDKKLFRGMSIIYVTCMPGKNELLSASTSYGLERSLICYKESHEMSF